MLTYKSGGGFLAAPNNAVPAAFKSLGDLLVYWAIHASSVGGQPGEVYLMNSVSPNTALCVHTAITSPFSIKTPFGGAGVPMPPTPEWLLYTTPSTVSQAWHYLVNFLKASPGINMGPAVSGLTVAQYVVIDSNIRKGPSSSCSTWYLSCNPDMTKLTRLL
jgi:hypothetical protein